MKKNWFFILILSIAALSLAGTAAYFSVFGLTKLFLAAGLGITILAASLEFAKLVTVSYVYRFWKTIKKGLRGFYIFAVVFIMFLTSIGIYGFLTGAYQQSANKIEMRDSQIKIAENKRELFVSQLNRVNKSIESSSERINTLSGLRSQQERRLDNLYTDKSLTSARRTETQISSSDEQIKILNEDITEKMKQTGAINDSIAFYDQKIIELKNSDVSNEIGPYKFVADLTGLPIGKIVNIVAILIVLVFDPLAIALLIGVNQLTMNMKEEKEDIKEETEVKEPKKSFFDRFKFQKKTLINNELDNTLVSDNQPINTIENEKVTEVIQDEPEEVQSFLNVFNTTTPEPIVPSDNEFEPKKVASVTGRINTAHFIPRN